MAEEGLRYWLRWQVPVCALIFAVPLTVAIYLIIRRQRSPLNGSDLWIPCWRKLHPLWLLIYRSIAFVSMSWMLYQLVASVGFFAFYFYTQWTFSLVIIYFALGTVISAHGCWTYSKHYIENEERGRLLKMDLGESKGTKITSTNKMKSPVKLQSHHEQDVNERTAGFWGYLMLAIYQTCAGAVMLTDIVFWCLLVPFMSDEHFSVTLLIGCMHALNAVFLLLDTALSRMSFPWFRLAYFVLWSGIYVIFQWVLHACGFSWWPYPFLELTTPWAPLWYLCLALVHIPCYGFYVLIVVVKDSIFSKLFPHAYIRSY
ncbi:hypothetical protein AAC387_Pa10g2109 [Persea americana]